MIEPLGEIDHVLWWFNPIAPVVMPEYRQVIGGRRQVANEGEQFDRGPSRELDAVVSQVFMNDLTDDPREVPYYSLDRGSAHQIWDKFIEQNKSVSILSPWQGRSRQWSLQFHPDKTKIRAYTFPMVMCLSALYSIGLYKPDPYNQPRLP